MDQSPDIPYCPLPEDTPNDMVPMLVVIGLFVLAGWLFRIWRKRRVSKGRK